MDFQDFSKVIQDKQQQIEQYVNDAGLTMVKRETYRFIDNNFRMQGWQGTSFEPWKANKKGTTILVKSGHLKNGFNEDTMPGAVRFYNNVPYASVHNMGFKGAVQVAAHNRFKYGKVDVNDIHTRKIRKVYTQTSQSEVKSHTRNLNIDRRQFAPTDDSPSPILIEAIRGELEKDIMKMFNF